MIKFPSRDEHGRERTGYAVECYEHKLVYLSQREYNTQMESPDKTWRCPSCNDDAIWNDENYEDFFGVS